MRTEPEIRAALERMKTIQGQNRRRGRAIDAAMAAIFVSALSWVLGETKTITERIKVE